MIDPRMVSRYLAAEHDNHTWIKDQSKQWALDKLPHKVLQSSYQHQAACTYLGVKYPQFAFFLKMGLGKSKLVLDIIQIRRTVRSGLRTLILCPYLINLSGWKDQIDAHAPDLTYRILYGSSIDRQEELERQEADIYVLNYTGFCAMVSTLSFNPKTKKNEWKLNPRKLNLFNEMFDVLVLDESTACKNHRTITYQACLALSQAMPFRYLLTGTPFGSSPHDIWAQYMILDHGETFGKTLTLFRQGFFSTKVNYWGGYEYTFDKTKQDLFTKKLEHRSIHYTVDECLDLPPQIATPIYLDWDPEAKNYYAALKDSFIEMVKAKGTTVQLKNHFMRLRQITSGFLMHKDEDESTVIHFAQNPKLDALLELLEQADPQDKFVVFHFFIETGALIEKALSAQKIKHTQIWSGTKDKDLAFHQFTDHPSNRVLIINEQIGALGLNIQMANYIVFFESPLSPIVREQAEARCRRPGQTKTIFCFDLIINGSIDAKIHESVRAGKNLLQEVLSGHPISDL